MAIYNNKTERRLLEIQHQETLESEVDTPSSEISDEESPQPEPAVAQPRETVRQGMQDTMQQPFQGWEDYLAAQRTSLGNGYNSDIGLQYVDTAKMGAKLQSLSSQYAKFDVKLRNAKAKFRIKFIDKIFNTLPLIPSLGKLEKKHATTKEQLQQEKDLLYHFTGANQPVFYSPEQPEQLQQHTSVQDFPEIEGLASEEQVLRPGNEFQETPIVDEVPPFMEAEEVEADFDEYESFMANQERTPNYTQTESVNENTQQLENTETQQEQSRIGGLRRFYHASIDWVMNTATPYTSQKYEDIMSVDWREKGRNLRGLGGRILNTLPLEKIPYNKRRRNPPHQSPPEN